MSSLVQDSEVTKAVSRIRQRSERQEDLQKLVDSYVDVGPLAQLENANNQILYGRSGTGKTHVLRVLASRFAADPNSCVLYIDCRTLGSTSQFSDPSLPIELRCYSLFKDILDLLYVNLLEFVFEHQVPNATKALESLDALNSSISEPAQRQVSADLTNELGSARKAQGSAKIGVSALGVEASGELSSTEKSSVTKKVAYTEKIDFPAVHQHLSKMLDLTKSRLFLMIDEWSSIPVEVQPYLAEFVKRGILPLQSATVKIGALEYRSRFGTRLKDGSVLGFELGADIDIDRPR